MENPIKIDDLEVPLFLETPIWKTIDRPDRRKCFTLSPVSDRVFSIRSGSSCASFEAQRLPDDAVPRGFQRHPHGHVMAYKWRGGPKH